MNLFENTKQKQLSTRNNQLHEELKQLEASYQEDPSSIHQQDLDAFLFRYRQNKDGSFQDRFMEGWMLIKVLEHQTFNWFTKKRITKEFHLCLEQLGVYQIKKNPAIQKQWQEFSNFYVQCCFQDPTFRNALFGMGNVGDENVSKRIFHEIVLVTKQLPERFHEDDVLNPLYDCMVKAFYANVKEADEIIND